MEYYGTLDDKCRISLPARIRGNLKENKLILTKGINHSIWAFELKEWEDFKNQFKGSATISRNKQLIMQHKFIAPQTGVDIDKAGRIAIPQSLRGYADLSQKITILEVVDHLEIWDTEQYEAYIEANEAQIMEILEEMGPVTGFDGSPG